MTNDLRSPSGRAAPPAPHPPTTAHDTTDTGRSGAAREHVKPRRCQITCSAESCCRMQAYGRLAGKDRLVGTGFRCWLAGYHFQDVAPWDVAFTDYEQSLGAEPARRAIGELGFWCRAIWHSRARDIEVYPHACRAFCRDECLAISMIGAVQHGNPVLACRCAAALLGTPEAPAAVLDAARLFAASLDRIGVVLPRKVAVHAPVGPEEMRT